jgi:hypothetical protein
MIRDVQWPGSYEHNEIENHDGLDQIMLNTFGLPFAGVYVWMKTRTRRCNCVVVAQ